jgi:hypothetical protein
MNNRSIGLGRCAVIFPKAVVKTTLEKLAQRAAIQNERSRIWKSFVLFLALLLVGDATAGTGGFVPTGDMSRPRFTHAAALLGNGTVLVVGSADSFGGPPDSSAEIYNPVTGSFSLTGSMGTGRVEGTFTLLGDGRVVAIGGHNGTSPVGSSEVYDPATGTFSPSGMLITARDWHTATLLPNGKVLVTGGYLNGSLASAELYDPSTGTFTATGSMTTARWGHSATLLQDGRVLILGGGLPENIGDQLTSAEIYDPNTGTFTLAGSMSIPHPSHTATLLQSGKVLVTGIDEFNPPPSAAPTAELFDPASGTFSPAGNMLIQRSFHQATLLPDGTVLITGGSAPNNGPARQAEIYDQTTAGFRCTGMMEVDRRFHTATLLPNGKVLVTGGYTLSIGGLLASAELWDASIISPPFVANIDPYSTIENGPGFTLTISGWDFDSGATVRWNGAARPTTFVRGDQLTAAINSADIASTAEFVATATVTVSNPDGQVSAPQTFSIYNPEIASVQAGTIGPGGSGFTMVDGNEHGVNGFVNNQETAPLPITVAVYNQDPASRPLADLGGGFLAFRITGASVADSATVIFDFPAENISLNLATPGFSLLYFNGSFWAPVLSSGGVAPTLLYDQSGGDFFDGYASGNFSVVFDNTSTPKITELGNPFIFGFGFLPNLDYQDFANGAVGLGGSGGALWFDNFQVGAPGVPPQLISTVDYSDTFTITPTRVDGLYNDNSNGAYDLEDNYGNPPATWTPTLTGIFSFNTPSSTTHPPIVSAATGNPGANTGLAQATDDDFNFSYGLRSDYVVQVDAILPVDHFDDNRVDISSLAAAGDSPATFGGTSANSLTVFFWPDSSTRGGITVDNGFWETHLHDASGVPILTGVNDHNWHNYAVEFNQTAKTLKIYVDRLLKATVDLRTFAFPVTISCPANILVTAPSGQNSVTVNLNVTATSSLGNDVQVVCNPPSGSTFPVGNTTVNCTATDPFGNQSSCSFNVTVNPPPPTISSISPNTKTAGSSAFTLTVNGSDFVNGATVQWNGAARATTFLSSSHLTASIAASDVVGGSDIVDALVTVQNPNGAQSNPQSFAITPATVSAAQTTAASPGQTVSISTAPTTAGQVGVTATINNAGGQPVSLTVANYSSNPSGTGFSAGGGFTDVQISGASSADTATVNFYYPSTIDPATEVALTLVYYNGSGWIQVLSSGGTAPVKNTTDNLDGTISGGRFTVVFSSTSTPTITQLQGTVFGAANVAPAIALVNTPSSPTPIQTAVPITINYSTAGNPNTHQVTMNWGDGSSTALTPTVSGIVNSSHVYTAAGVYTIVVTLNDGVHSPVQATSQYVVVYDPNGGFVTGGGWINSPVGAYTPNPSLTGKATFGFVSKYQKGASVPSGQTQFQFQMANFNFQSTAYQWLVISAAKAQYKGTGTINGASGYTFILTATDGELKGGGGLDKLRIHITNTTTGATVYDNVAGGPDDINNSNPQAIGGGSIVIHSN